MDKYTHTHKYGCTHTHTHTHTRLQVDIARSISFEHVMGTQCQWIADELRLAGKSAEAIKKYEECIPPPEGPCGSTPCKEQSPCPGTDPCQTPPPCP
jgi:hypothetical protein